MLKFTKLGTEECRPEEVNSEKYMIIPVRCSDGGSAGRSDD